MAIQAKHGQVKTIIHIPALRLAKSGKPGQENEGSDHLNAPQPLSSALFPTI
jgi:hypothetical protein